MRSRVRVWFVSVVGATVLFAAGCHLFTSAPPVAPNADAGLGSCMEADVHNVAVQIMPAVATAIATDGYVAALASLVAQFGTEAVTCAVEAMESELEAAHFAGANDADVDTMVAHARAWLHMPPLPVARVMRFDGPSTSI